MRASLLLFVGMTGLYLMIQSLGSLILSKWSSQISHCLARGEDKTVCINEAKKSLSRQLAFKNVDVKINEPRGIIHTEIAGKLLGRTILRSSYDLEPSEYLRKQ